MEFAYAIDKLKSKLEKSDFYRIMLEGSKSENIIAKEGKIDSVNQNEHFGLSIFYTVGKFGYFYSTNNPEDLDKFKIDLALKKYSNLDYTPKESGIKDSKVIGEKSNLDLEYVAKELAKKTKLKDKIISHDARYFNNEIHRKIVCRNTDIEQTQYRGFVLSSCTAKENNVLRKNTDRIAKGNSLNNYFDNFILNNEKFEKETVEKLSLKEGLTGKYSVILDPTVTSLLAHEAIGHSCEADLVYNKQSILRNKLGKTLAKDFVSLADDPTVRDNLFGSFYYDDEGFKAKTRYLIKEGKLNDYILNDRYSQLMKMENNAGSRTINYTHLPIPRMSNTSFLPGKITINEMIKEMRNGVILSGFNGGETNPAVGTYQFGVKEAKIVKNGEIKETRVNLSYSGSILNSLKNIVDVSKDIKMDSPGFCGKEDQSGLPCDSFDPYLLVKNVRLG